ncbi:MFS transporter [Granulicella sp. WH15]|uniref:MFS transporter n=1 Tax=Granulicella sp. WH15 TaxID=2602070 RepID=UPI0013676D77|nr:MFS transporter [Granulicella sp. WH15]QHN03953.1 MFS transporter [Granulicella sp. WH15]
MEPIRSCIAARLDRLPWARWHWLIVIALGITWVLDGLEVTLAGTIGGVLKTSLRMSDAQVGQSATCYLTGAVIGALFFGWLTDRLGRKKLFTVTLLVYLLATAATALSWNFHSYSLFRFITGLGIGGEYAAINSAIDELIPARLRGRIDLIINSTYWLGAALGAAVTVILFNGHLVPEQLAWRFAFGLGALLGIGIIFLRHHVPESPRWLVIHGRNDEAEKIVHDVEETVVHETGQRLPPTTEEPVEIHPRTHTSLHEIWAAMTGENRTRTFLGLSLMIAQAFFYNAIFFTYALVLERFYRIPPTHAGYYIFPFAIGNVLGPVLLGHLFDTVGRKKMIALTYALSGALLLLTGALFEANLLTATTQTACWTVIFFVASAAASSAYLTVSEIFPLEVRAMAISIFYAVGTLIGGAGAPALFGHLIESRSRTPLFGGYIAAAILMIFAAIVELVLGVAAEGKSLEQISRPLSAKM